MTMVARNPVKVRIPIIGCLVVMCIFYRTRAVLHSRIGPGTLVTRAENAFDKITGRLRKRYGAPTDDRIDYVTELIVMVKEATWNVDHSSITVKCEGAGGPTGIC